MYNAGKSLGLIVVALLMMCCLHEAVASDQSKPVTYHVDTTQSIGEIDVNIYGQFLEHIFNSVHGGLWGDMILNPSFERRPAVATWVIEDGAITTEDIAEETPVPFGDEKWTDYEITMEAKVTQGNKGLNIPFRWQGPKDYYMMNFGVAGHRKWSLEKISRGGQSFPFQGDMDRPGMEMDKWHKV